MVIPLRKVSTPPAGPLVLSLVLTLIPGCGSDPSGSPAGSTDAARLHARPSEPGDLLGPGTHLFTDAPGFLHIPEGLEAGQGAPLVVLLHGAGGSASSWPETVALAASLGVVAVVGESRGSTWDATRGAFGPDVRNLDRALAQAFDHVRIDPARIALAGFSDGASYALSLGLTNGDLFTHLVAFSPGFVFSPARHGRPRIWVSHGVHDGIIDIDGSSREFVEALRGSGYDVTYVEFQGGHDVPREVARQAFEWLLGGG